MSDMRVDHVSYAAEHDGLHATAGRLAKLIGVEPVDGGIHARFGTRNLTFPLAEGRYLEVVEVLDHPAADKAPFGQAVRARSEAGGGWLGWVVRVEDLAPIERRLGRQAVEGMRRVADGREYHWHQLGVRGLMSDPQLPFYVCWDDGSMHPSDGGGDGVGIDSLTIAGDPARVRDWLGFPAGETSNAINFTFIAPHGTPGLMAVTFSTPDGPVTV